MKGFESKLTMIIVSFLLLIAAAFLKVDIILCVFSIVGIITAGFFNGYMDSHTVVTNSILPTFLPIDCVYQFNQEDENMHGLNRKYKNGDRTQGEAFKLSTTHLIFLTSVWYYSKYIMLLSLSVAIFSTVLIMPNLYFAICLLLAFSPLFSASKNFAQFETSKKYKLFNKILFFPLILSTKYIYKEDENA